MSDINLGRFNVGNVDRLRVTITKDGAAWNLAIGSVSIRFETPAGVRGDWIPMLPESTIGGIFFYDTTTSLIDTAGDWKVGIKVIDGTVTKIYPEEILMEVEDQP